jgi:hypothetical protein
MKNKELLFEVKSEPIDEEQKTNEVNDQPEQKRRLVQIHLSLRGTFSVPICQSCIERVTALCFECKEQIMIRLHQEYEASGLFSDSIGTFVPYWDGCDITPTVNLCNSNPIKM